MSKYTRQFFKDSEWSNKYGNLIIVDYINKNKILVKFLLTGFEKYTNASAIRNGSVKDPYFPTVAKVGYKGNTTSSVNGKVKNSYHTWRGMLSRCYEYKESTKTYFEKVEVCKEWWCFETFERWYGENYIEGFKLDKDLTVIGSNLYSPDTCSFIPNRINCVLGRKDYHTGLKHQGLPVGVSYHKRDKKYTSQYFDGEKLQHLGYYSTPESAFRIYKNSKEAILKDLAQEYFDKGEISLSVYNNLMDYEVLPYRL